MLTDSFVHPADHRFKNRHLQIICLAEPPRTHTQETVIIVNME